MRTFKFWFVSLVIGASACTAAGDRGLTGNAGPAGVQGNTGASGMAGPAGSQGAAGALGAQGPAGATGAAGATGPQGPAGPGSSGTTKAVLIVDAHGAVVGPGPGGLPGGDPLYFDSNGYNWTISEADATIGTNVHWDLIYGAANCQGPAYVGYNVSRIVITIATMPGFWALQDNPPSVNLMAYSQTSNGSCADFGGPIDVGIQFPVSAFVRVSMPDAGYTVPFHLEWR
jgi:hypothetical protein